MKILLTGGHPAPALAILDEIQTKHPELSVVFVGRQYNNADEKTESFEYKEVTKRNIAFIHLEAGRLTRLLSVSSIVNAFRTPVGFMKAYSILTREKPDRIVTFGGYIGLPVALAGKILGIPVYAHEQTIQPGLANRIIASVAKKVFISFPQSAASFPAQKTLLTGNLLRDDIFKATVQPFQIPSTMPVIYVTGGSLGSHSVNIHIEHILPELLKLAVVIHQTGNVQEYNDFQRLINVKESLPPELKANYFVVEHVSAEEIGFMYSKANLVIGRSGANTVTELIALKKPAILIPLPWSARNEQLLQAQLLEQAGTAKIFLQSGNSEELLKLIQMMLPKLAEYSANYKNISNLYVPNASTMVMEAVLQD